MGLCWAPGVCGFPTLIIVLREPSAYHGRLSLVGPIAHAPSVRVDIQAAGSWRCRRCSWPPWRPPWWGPDTWPVCPRAAAGQAWRPGGCAGWLGRVSLGASPPPTAVWRPSGSDPAGVVPASLPAVFPSLPPWPGRPLDVPGPRGWPSRGLRPAGGSPFRVSRSPVRIGRHPAADHRQCDPPSYLLAALCRSHLARPLDKLAVSCCMAACRREPFNPSPPVQQRLRLRRPRRQPAPPRPYGVSSHPEREYLLFPSSSMGRLAGEPRSTTR